jgi:hypothetical protein
MVYVGARTFALWDDAMAYACLPNFFYSGGETYPRRRVFRAAGAWAVQGTRRPSRYRPSGL